MLKNPFLVYILTFGCVLAAYQLGWSDIYPAMSRSTLVFFALSFLLSGAFALAASPYVTATGEYLPKQLPGYVILALLVCFAADLMYTGSVPLLEMMRGRFAYGSFVGIPSLHVFAVTFGSAFATIRFADFLYESDIRKRLHFLAEAMVPVMYLLLVVYRGSTLILLTSWAFVFVIKRGRLEFRPAVTIAIIGLGILMLNGVIGEVRTGSLKKFGWPSQEFRDSGIPESYFATYLYATGPLANFQYAVTTTKPPFDPSRIPEFMVGEMLPDFISNRVLPRIGAQRATIPQMSPGFNVASMFGRSYLFFGWIGVLTIFAWLMALTFVYLVLILRSSYCVPCLALLNTLVVFSVFDNMIAVSSMSLQLIWPLLLPLLPAQRKRMAVGT